MRPLVVMLLTAVAAGADEPPNKKMLDGLRPLHQAVGSWKGTGSTDRVLPWQQKLECTWGFRAKDGRVSLNFFAGAGKLLRRGLLTFSPDDGTFRLTIENPKKEVLRFEGKLQESATSLRLDRKDADAKDGLDRVEFKVVRAGDKLLFDFRKKRGKSAFENVATIELFREGGDDASAEKFKEGPYCIVTGGAGRVKFTHDNRTFHVACEACKEEFLAHPERYRGK